MRIYMYVIQKGNGFYEWKSTMFTVQGLGFRV